MADPETDKRLVARLGRVLIASANEFHIFHADTLQLLALSDGARRNLGYAAEENPQLTPVDILPEFSRGGFECLTSPLRTRKQSDLTFTTMVRRRDGSTYPAEIRLQFSAEDQPPVFIAAIQDSSETQAREAELLRVSRAMMALTRATEVLIHAENEQELLNEVCRIIVELAGYRLCWLGYAMPDRTVRPVAQCGFDQGYVAQVRVTWADDARGRGPAGTAIRTGRTTVFHDLVNTEEFAPWRESALRHSFASSIGLPLRLRDRIIGAFCIYAVETDAFDEREVRLLEDLASNLSYGLDMLRLKAERRRAEQELKESESRYRTLVEMSPDVILVQSGGRILFANDAARKVFRAGPTDLIDRPIIDLVAHEDKLRCTQRLRQNMANPSVSQFRLLRCNGEPFAAEVAAASVTFHGIAARQVVVRDITERKLIEAQLIQAGKLATLGEMAAGMAHELSQPLNIMRMAAEGALLLIRRGKASPEYQSNQFALISDQARRMAEIIDHIRIFSRKDTGGVEVFDSLEAVRMAAELIARQLHGDDIELRLILPDTPYPVLGRPVQLEQVVVNLLSNAVDSVRAVRTGPKSGASARGMVEVTACIEPGSGDGSGVRIAVADNGGGIPAELMDRIFEPFFTTKEVGHGTGLGLSVSFGIVQSMGGRLEAQNRDNGAVFEITLPLTHQPMTGESRRTSETELSGTVTDWHILVVDDEIEAVKAMAAYLRELGFRVSTAHNGTAAYRLFVDDPADMVITDIRMPQGDGRQLIGDLREADDTLPIIVVTGHMGATESVGLDDGHTVVLKKPVSLEVLAETVERLMRPVFAV